MKRKAFVLLLFLAIFTLGFGREYVFERLNEVLGTKYARYEIDYIYSISIWLNQFDYWMLYYAKWVLTIIASLLFLLLSLSTVWVWHRNFTYLKVGFFFFLGIYGLSAIIFGLGWVLGATDEGYKMTRMTMEIVQSPLLIMFLIPSLGLLGKLK